MPLNQVTSAYAFLPTSGHRERRDRVECRTKVVALELEVVAGLEVDPEALTRAEEPSEPQGGVRADPSLSVDDLIDPSRRDADRHREAVLGNPKRLEEVHEQDLARVDGAIVVVISVPLSDSR